MVEPFSYPKVIPLSYLLDGFIWRQACHWIKNGITTKKDFKVLEVLFQRIHYYYNEPSCLASMYTKLVSSELSKDISVLIQRRMHSLNPCARTRVHIWMPTPTKTHMHKLTHKTCTQTLTYIYAQLRINAFPWRRCWFLAWQWCCYVLRSPSMRLSTLLFLNTVKCWNIVYQYY